MQGKIVKGIAGFYYIHVVGSGVYECKAKGAFRREKIRPLVGDNVEIEVLNEGEKTGNMIQVFPRSNELIRPAVANIDQVLLVFAVLQPNPHYNLLDRFLVMMEDKLLPVILCFNKTDLAADAQIEELQAIYGGCGYPMIFTSAREEENIDRVRAVLKGKTTAIAGPSGVGKSSIINILHPEANMETGEISAKIERGKHTTRHSELIAIGEGSYILDTPGFSSLGLFDLEKERLAGFYPEFAAHERYCRFGGCAHIGEKDCGVKSAVEEGAVSRMRYENYRLLYEELKGMERKKVRRL